MIFIRNLRPLQPLRLCGRYSEIGLSLRRAGFFVMRSYSALIGEFTIGIDSRRSSRDSARNLWLHAAIQAMHLPWFEL